MCGLKGLGCLVINNQDQITPIIHGGGQQEGMRGGTENFASIKVWGLYIDSKIKHYQKDKQKLEQLDSYLIHKLQEEFVNDINFHSLLGKGERVPGIVNVSFKGIINIKLVNYLVKKNIVVGFGSACSQLHLENSDTLTAMGLTEQEIANTLRISFDENNSIRDLYQLIKNIHIFKKSIYLKKKSEENEMNLPDCESYRKLALKYLLNKIRN